MDAKRLLGVIGRLIPMFVVAACAAADGGREGRPATPSPVPSQTLYVAASPGCAGRAPCYRTVQDAVDAAPEGALVKVAAGVYTSTEPHVLVIEKTVDLVGGYAVEDWSRSDPAVQRPVLDAEGAPGRRGVYIDGTDALTITLTGFQIQHGYAQESAGGGIHVAGGLVILENNAILSSTADTSGGGVFVGGGDVTLRRNIIRGNSARYGGGLYVDQGVVSLESDVFTENDAGPVGGAIAMGGGELTGTNVTVAGNHMADAGIYVCGGHLTGSHWTLADNGRYGVIADLGIQIDSGSARLRNSIVSSHTTGFFGAGTAGHQTLFHRVDNPCIAGASCVSNIFGDPKFADPLQNDYHITRDSAAVDQAHGIDTFADMDGEERPLGGATDIGADEVETEVTVYLPLVLRQSVPLGP